MAGKLTINAVQLGDSITASQNFVLQTNADGTAKLSRGNLGATTQDILTVDASGGVSIRGGVVAPAPGMVGEILTATGGTGSLSTGAIGNAITYSLPAGVWDVTGTVGLDTTGTVQTWQAGISLVSAAAGTALTRSGGVTTGYAWSAETPLVRIIATATTPIYLTARCVFSTGAVNITGSTFTARRVA